MSENTCSWNEREALEMAAHIQVQLISFAREALETAENIQAALMCFAMKDGPEVREAREDAAVIESEAVGKK